MKKESLLFTVFISVFLLFIACSKEGSDSTDQSPVTNTVHVNAIISGMVTDENNQPVIGAQVTTSGLSVSTDHYGIFLLKGNVTKDRCVLTIAKAGFTRRLHALIPKENTVNYVRIVLGVEPVAQNISASTGGTISLNTGGSIQFAANSFVINGTSTPYTGTVNVIASHLAPGSANFGLMIPGGDLAGKNAAGDDVALYSYGMTSVRLKGSGGEDLQLAAGTTASITFPIDPGQQGTAPVTISLWYLEEATALWIEEGIATKVGNNYVGTVVHFSWWNCDYSSYKATITGRVVDCEGIPLANITVTVNGALTLTTDGNGYYTKWVPSGLALNFQVLPQGIIIQPSQLENVAPLTNGQTFTVPDLIVPCGSRINGHITNCSDEATEGTVRIINNYLVVNFIHTTTGVFTLMGVENINYTLSAFSSTGMNSMVVTSPSALDSIDVGALQLCNNRYSGTCFYLTGNGYTDNLVGFSTTDINEAYWNTQNNTTVVAISGYTNMGDCGIEFDFPGQQAIIDYSTILVQDSINFYFELDDYFFAPSIVTNDPFTLEITHYGPVGDSIKGIFHGALQDNWTGPEVIISDGKFALPRTADR